MAVKFENWLGGISKSRADQRGFDDIGNCDIFSEEGYCTNNYFFEPVTSTNSPNELCVQCMSPAGTIYFFSTISGKIWKRTSAGVWSTVTANANGAHIGCHFFKLNTGNKIFYWTGSKIGIFDPETEANRNDSWATASNSNLGGSVELNEALWVADGNYITRTGLDGTFTANALDLPDKWNAYLVIDDINNLLIGANVSTSVQKSRFFLWDTYSDSWTLEDEVPENGANTFMKLDNMIIAQCGPIGRLYYWTGNRMEKFTNRLRNVNEGGVDTYKGYQRTVTFNGRTLIFAEQFIFSVHREFSGENVVIVRENTSDVGFTASATATNDTVFISGDSGVAQLSTTKYRRAAVITPEVRGNFNNVFVEYDENPNLVGIEIKSNSAASFTAVTPIIDSIRRLIYFDGGIADCHQLQARIVLNVDEDTPTAASGTVKPIIKSVTLL